MNKQEKTLRLWQSLAWLILFCGALFALMIQAAAI